MLCQLGSKPGGCLPQPAALCLFRTGLLTLHVFCSLSPSKQKGPDQKPSKQGSTHMPVWASFGGPQAPTGYEQIPGTAPNPQHEQGSSDEDPTTLFSNAADNSLSAGRPQLEVSFTNLSLRLKGTGKRVLAGVTGKLRARHLTAIMGPSGAGKHSN